MPTTRKFFQTKTKRDKNTYRLDFTLSSKIVEIIMGIIIVFFTPYYSLFTL